MTSRPAFQVVRVDLDVMATGHICPLGGQQAGNWKKIAERKNRREIEEIEIWKRERPEVKILRTTDDLMPGEP